MQQFRGARACLARNYYSLCSQYLATFTVQSKQCCFLGSGGNRDNLSRRGMQPSAKT